jgi:hypothetical protein
VGDARTASGLMRAPPEWLSLEQPRVWAKKLIEKKPFKLVAVALANKMARIAFAILRGKTTYREILA